MEPGDQSPNPNLAKEIQEAEPNDRVAEELGQENMGINSLENLIVDQPTVLQKDPPVEMANSQESSTLESNDDEDFQPVLRKRNRGKATTPICSLPKTINTRLAYKTNMLKDGMDKTILKDKGSGGVPISSSSKV